MAIIFGFPFEEAEFPVGACRRPRYPLGRHLAEIVNGDVVQCIPVGTEEMKELIL